MIAVECFMVSAKRAFPQRDIRNLAYRVLTGERRREALLRIVFIDDGRMSDIHAMFLRTATPTDVLSFPLTDEGSEILEGEVYINLDQAYRQAGEYDVSPREEIRRLVIHGILHLVGYDDKSRRKQAIMKAREDYYLAAEGPTPARKVRKPGRRPAPVKRKRRTASATRRSR